MAAAGRGMRALVDSEVRLHTREEIRAVGRAARLAAACLRAACSACRVGETTRRLARLAREHGEARGAVNLAVYASVNAAAAHQAPNGVVLRDGDIVTLDVSLMLGGWYGDVAWTCVAGTGSPLALALVDAAWRASWEAAQAVRCGGRITEISRRAHEVAARRGFALAEGCSGHGIGRELHEPPVITYADPSVEGWLVPGMVLTVEPVLCAGGGAIRLVDGVVVTADGAPAAHFEHTVALLSAGPVVLNGIP